MSAVSEPVADDAAARRQAIDITQSFIVQAPAGSGKTELLIQRLLALLARVHHPEELVAITFTRKAAAEMKNRLLTAVRRAREEPQPTPDHEARTWRLARAVVGRDKELNWRLEMEPQRLRIDTVDALNGWLAQRLPLAAGAVAGLEVVDDARGLYRLAAQRTVAAVVADDALGTALGHLLQMLDARLPRLEQLLAELAPRRDQWLRHVQPGVDPGQLRAELEGALERLVTDHLALVERHLPPAQRAALGEVLVGVGLPPLVTPPSLAAWQSAAGLLLTRNGAWRRQVTARDGFARTDHAAKDQFQSLMAELEPRAALREALEDLRHLPAAGYDEQQWQTLAALRLVLPRLIGELRVAFQEAETCDFVEVAIAAQQALGTSDDPSDLLLALDRRIQHILVDEFQDTSHTQLHLLEKLTAGWEPQDGRTLFLVGDPMQSIYRFRDADMSLFLRVKQQGIGDIRLRALTLQRNFRSDPVLVDWVNACFNRCMPRQDDMARGAAAYVAAEAARRPGSSAGVSQHLLPSGDPAAEASRVAELIAAELALDSSRSLAVLVQGRGHLAGLQNHLRAAGIAAQAVEIEAPNQHQVTQDLLGLTRALLHRQDRIAWLALLRMPFCGVSLADLAALCELDHDTAIWTLLTNPVCRGRLSIDGQRRLQWLSSTLTQVFAERGDHPLGYWLERAWHILGGDALADAQARALAQRFFSKLAMLCRCGDLDDPAALESAFIEPEPAPIAQVGARVQIMTVHRAKGLEFDTVILMGLGREWPSDDARALRWLERTNEDGGEDLLLAPLKGTAREDALHEFIRREEQARDDLERIRLAYVATTRARDRLHLVAQLPADRPRPPARSLLAHLWPAFAHAVPEQGAGVPPTEPLAPQLRRLPALDRSPSLSAPLPVTAAPEPPFEWVSQTAVHVGTVAHRWLQRLAAEGADAWPEARVEALLPHIHAELRLAGVPRHELTAAGHRVLEALTGSVSDSVGRWILDHRHRDGHAELALTVWSEAGPERVVLDRSFIDADGVRWIIDYKTSAHAGSGLEAFLDSEVERYRPQLERYARAMLLKERRPVHVGLYFPLLRSFRSWEPDTEALQRA